MATPRKPKKPAPKRTPPAASKKKPRGPQMGIGDFMQQQFDERRGSGTRKPAKPGAKSRRR